MPGAAAGPQEKSPAVPAHALGVAELPRESGAAPLSSAGILQNFYDTYPTSQREVRSGDARTH